MRVKGAYVRPRRRGSSTSRSESPSTLKENTASVMNTPGTIATWGAKEKAVSALESISPQVGVGGGIPNPKNPSALSVIMATPMRPVAITKYGATQPGTICRKNDAQVARADGSGRLHVWAFFDYQCIGPNYPGSVWYEGHSYGKNEGIEGTVEGCKQCQGQDNNWERH